MMRAKPYIDIGKLRLIVKLSLGLLLGVSSVKVWSAETQFKYYEYRPSSPLMRWTGDESLRHDLAWKVSYRLSATELKVGGLKILTPKMVWPDEGCKILNESRYDSIRLCRRKTTAPKLQLNGAEIAPSGELMLNEGMQYQFSAELIPDRLIEVSLKVPELDIVDLGMKQNQRRILYNLKQMDASLGGFWSYSFPAPEKLHFTAPSGKVGYFRWKSPAGIVMRRPLLTQSEWPMESLRPVVHLRRTLGSYNSQFKFKVFDSAKKEQVISSTGLESGFWNNQKMEMNGQTWEYRALRMFSSEASGRLSLVNGPDGGILMLGDATFSHYIEKFRESSTLDSFWSHRFGLRARGFSNLAGFTSGEKLNLTAFSGEVRVAVLPGLWNFDEIVGLQVGFSSITIEESKAKFGGVGFYWARPLPLIFDKILNVVPIFRYPKYVDLDFTNYDHHLGIGNFGQNFVMNFHGKMIFTERAFFELGYAWSRYEMEDDLRIRALDFFSMTTGFGYLF